MSEAIGNSDEAALAAATNYQSSRLSEMGRDGMSADQVLQATHPDAGKTLWNGGPALDVNGHTTEQATVAAVEQMRLVLFPALADSAHHATPAPFNGATSTLQNVGTDGTSHATNSFSGYTSTMDATIAAGDASVSDNIAIED